MKTRFIPAFAAGICAVVLSATPALAAHPTGFKSRGSGTEKSLSASGCQFTLAGCTVETDGKSVTSALGAGTYVSVLTVNWKGAAHSNGKGGYCAPATGTSIIKRHNGKGSLTLADTGVVCEVGATSASVAHSLTGTFTITGGTGRFAGASGGGTLTGGDNGRGTSSYAATGSINLPRWRR